MRIWNGTSYTQYGSVTTTDELAEAILASDSMIDAMALKTDLSEFTYATFAPTVSQGATMTTSTMVARYVQIGKFVHYLGSCTISSSGTSANGVGLTLPASAAAQLDGHAPIGTGMIFEGTTHYRAVAINDGPGIVFYNSDGTGGASRIGTNPSFQMVSGDKIWWNVMYEAS